MIQITLPEVITSILDKLEKAGFATYVVGGCVRDGLRGLPPYDWDACTSAKPEEVHTILDCEYKVTDTGLKHGTVTVNKGGIDLELTTFRLEGAYSDGRRPDNVVFVSDVKSDLKRRDFTMGAIAYSPIHGICDPFDGISDLNNGILKCVGNPCDRFNEDALRILRGLRFVSQHGFKLEEKTLQAMNDQKSKLAHIAPERIRMELTRILCGRYVGRVLRQHREIIAAALPEIAQMFDVDQQNKHHMYDVWEHSVRTLEQVPATETLRWAALLHDIGKPASKTIDNYNIGHFYGHPTLSAGITKQIVKRLRFDLKMQNRLDFLVDKHDIPMYTIEKQVRRAVAMYGESAVRELFALKKGDRTGQGTHPDSIATLCRMERMLNHIIENNYCLSQAQLAVNGYDIAALGYKGEQIGQCLDALLRYVIAYPDENDKETLLDIAIRIEEDEIL